MEKDKSTWKDALSSAAKRWLNPEPPDLTPLLVMFLVVVGICAMLFAGYLALIVARGDTDRRFGFNFKQAPEGVRLFVVCAGGLFFPLTLSLAALWAFAQLRHVVRPVAQALWQFVRSLRNISSVLRGVYRAFRPSKNEKSR